MLEIFVRRLDSETLRGKITKTVFGQDAAQNELTRYLIEVADCAKRQKIPTFAERCGDLDSNILLPELNSVK